MRPFVKSLIAVLVMAILMLTTEYYFQYRELNFQRTQMENLEEALRLQAQINTQTRRRCYKHEYRLAELTFAKGQYFCPNEKLINCQPDGVKMPSFSDLPNPFGAERDNEKDPGSYSSSPIETFYCDQGFKEWAKQNCKTQFAE